MGSLSSQTKIFIFFYLVLLPSHYAYSTQALSHQSFNLETSIEVTPVPTFKLVGTAKMKWLWFEIYEAKVLTPTGTYELNKWPLSLDLLYKKTISAEQLIQSTIDEWERQNIDYRVEWVSRLRNIWPDIAPQDQLILYVDEEGISHFFYNKRFIGSLSEPLFSSAFTAIWLSKNTLKPTQRNQLIGIKP